jgi:hypothetical protein
MAVSVAPLTTAVMNSVPQNRAGIASGVNNAVARTAGLVAIAIFGIVMLDIFRNDLDRQLKAARIAPTVSRSLQAQAIKLAAIETPDHQDLAAQQLIRRAIDDSFVSGFRFVMLVGALLAAASAAVALILIAAAPK